MSRALESWVGGNWRPERLERMKVTVGILLVGLTLICVSSTGWCDQHEPYRIDVNCAKDAGTLNHFWRITHVFTARRLLDADLQQEMEYIGGLPHGMLIYVRLHSLLDLVKVQDFETGNPAYDWSQLDIVLDSMVSSRLKPFFEFMGCPKGVPTISDTDGPESFSAEAWKRLAHDVAAHCVERYGRDEVLTWYFETWNEPEGRGQSLWDHYDGCLAGLKEVDPRFKFGGPGTYVTLGQAFTDLIEHCDTGKNYFTGKPGTRMDFISYHEKGVKRSSPTDANPQLKEWIDREIAIIKYVRAKHPRFANTLFINDECNPKGGGVQLYAWRGGPYFPAVIAKYARHHLQRLVDEMGVRTMACHDSFRAGLWGQQSHVVRFGDETKFELLKLPLNNGTLMLSMLGHTRCKLDQPDLFSDVGAIATKIGKEQIAVLVYNCNEVGLREMHDDGLRVLEMYGTAKIKLRLENTPFQEGILVHYRLDKEHSNPQGVWQRQGSPEAPNAEQMAQMCAEQELTMLDGPREVKAKNGELAVDFDLPMPGLSLIMFSAKPDKWPDKVTGLRTKPSPSLLGLDEIMLVWKPLPSRVLRTYEVLYSESPNGPFQRINKSDMISAAFLHVKATKTGKGYYKVRAVDYWGRAGKESGVVAWKL